ncbi:MAG: 4Fe-4S binding protein, partial [Endomicrobia bacterium]|nr:4Fe-4S binding protein [Endomicrobiia bacterium]
VKSCPKKIIKLVPCSYHTHILCSSQDKGVVVKQICNVGCIGCGLCVKVCHVNDIFLQNNLAVMKYNKCDNCGACITKCPTKCIISKINTDIAEQLKQTIKNFSLNIAK